MTDPVRDALIEACLHAARLLDPPVNHPGDIAAAEAVLMRLRPRLEADWPDPEAYLVAGIDCYFRIMGDGSYRPEIRRSVARGQLIACLRDFHVQRLSYARQALVKAGVTEAAPRVRRVC